MLEPGDGGGWTYPAYMEPVPFPTAAAQAAAAECRSMARLVDEKMGIVSAAATEARARWQGGYADDFGIAWPDTEQSGSDIADRLRLLAGQIEDALATVVAENRRRESLRQDYADERQRRNVPV